jgi:hypothetical protein
MPPYLPLTSHIKGAYQEYTREVNVCHGKEVYGNRYVKCKALSNGISLTQPCKVENKHTQHFTQASVPLTRDHQRKGVPEMASGEGVI